jgi:hypothetical protein
MLSDGSDFTDPSVIPFMMGGYARYGGFVTDSEIEVFDDEEEQKATRDFLEHYND